MKRNYISMAAAFLSLLTFTACSSDEGMAGGRTFANDPDAVYINASIGGAMTNAASRSNPIGTDKEQGEFNVGDVIEVSDDGFKLTPYQYQLGASGWQPVVAANYLKWKTKTISVSARTVFFPSYFDQSTIGNLRKCDQMELNNESKTKTADRSINLSLRRTKARIVLNSITYADQYANGNGEVKDVKLKEGSNTYLPYHHTDGKYYVLVEPGKEQLFEITVRNKVTGADDVLKTTSFSSPVAGKSYSFDITVGKERALISNITVKDWTTGAVIEGNGKTEYHPEVKTWRGTYAEFNNSGNYVADIDGYGVWNINFGTLHDNHLLDVKDKMNALAKTRALVLDGGGTCPPSIFEKNTLINSITLPNADLLGYGAFRNCENLTTAVLTKIKIIGDYAFENSFLLSTLHAPAVEGINLQGLSCTALKSVDMPLLTAAGYRAFFNCKELASVNMPLLKSAGYYIFYGCGKLATVSLPALTSIGDSGFESCMSLTSVDLPSATKIDKGTFMDCESLTDLKLTARGKMTLGLSSKDISASAGTIIDTASAAHCTLTLNEDKKPGGTGTPSVGSDGKTWGGVTWKEIKYVDK